ncbi:MAG: HAD family phosphatase [Oscillospiraceae bacterium]|nr:HAD family phosphatase [Oscillospiraceae bacterium]
MQKIKGAIFDLDGTLLDSMWKWGDVAEDYLTSHGAVPKPGLMKILRAFNTTEEAQYYIDEYGIDKPLDDVIKGRDDMMFKFFSNDVKLKEGVLPLLEALKKQGVKMCIATATDKWLVDAAVELHGLMNYFERIYTCTEENTSKKYPDIFFKAANFLGTQAGETLVVEDALYAMNTAKKAGFIVAGVYDKVADDEQAEVKAVCDYYCTNPGELLKNL